MIELRDVTKHFGAHCAVDGLTLAVPRASVYGFIGPNGSGKTTTLRMIMNILYPDSGAIRVFGEAMRPALCDRIGYMPEERGLYKRMRVRELLEFLCSLKDGAGARASVRSWLERLDLVDWAEKKVEALSKGMSQKVQFIAAVAARPELVILDEPFSGLDPVNTETIKDAVLSMQASGCTVIFSTHDMAMAERMCDRIFMIHRGRKVLDGTLAEIQGAYGEDTVRLRCDGGANALRGIAGVETVNDYGQQQELRLAPGTDTQAVLRAILERTRVHGFDVVKPSLHDIFVRIAGGKEDDHA